MDFLSLYRILLRGNSLLRQTTCLRCNCSWWENQNQSLCDIFFWSHKQMIPSLCALIILVYVNRMWPEPEAIVVSREASDERLHLVSEECDSSKGLNQKTALEKFTRVQMQFRHLIRRFRLWKWNWRLQEQRKNPYEWLTRF